MGGKFGIWREVPPNPLFVYRNLKDKLWRERGGPETAGPNCLGNQEIYQGGTDPRRGVLRNGPQEGGPEGGLQERSPLCP